MAKKVTIFRVSLATDLDTFNISEDPDDINDRIDFNDPGNSSLKNARQENAWITEIERIRGDGVGDDQPAEQDLGSIDTQGSTEDVYALRGIISKRDGDLSDGQNQFLIQLDLWSAEPKKNDNWSEGRFGIIDQGNDTNNLIPVGTGSTQIGLIWESYSTKTDLSKNIEIIELRFRVSRGDGT